VTDQPVQMFSSGPPRTVLPPEDPAVLAALSAAGGDRDAITAVVADHPRSLFA